MVKCYYYYWLYERVKNARSCIHWQLLLGVMLFGFGSWTVFRWEYLWAQVWCFRFCSAPRATLIRWFKYSNSKFQNLTSSSVTLESFLTLWRRLSPASVVVTSFLSLRFSVAVWTNPQRRNGIKGILCAFWLKLGCNNIYWGVRMNSN